MISISTPVETYDLLGGSGVNNLVVTCQDSGDDVYLSQESGSEFEVTGTISGNSLTMWTWGMEDLGTPSLDSITVYGSIAGSNDLQACDQHGNSKMSVGVDLIGRGPGNTLVGGERHGHTRWGIRRRGRVVRRKQQRRLYISGTQ